MQIQKVYEEVKNFFRPARLFEREFVIVPVYLPGHWAVSVVCRPQALVRELLGQHVGDSDKHARVSPSILYADSMGSKGLCFRLVLARVLVQHYLELNPVNGTLALQLSDSDLKARLGPEVSTPIQDDTFSCADNALHATRRIMTDMVRPSLLHLVGAAGGGGEICVESIMTSDWFTGGNDGGGAVPDSRALGDADCAAAAAAAVAAAAAASGFTAAPRSAGRRSRTRAR